MKAPLHPNNKNCITWDRLINMYCNWFSMLVMLMVRDALYRSHISIQIPLAVQEEEVENEHLINIVREHRS